MADTHGVNANLPATIFESQAQRFRIDR